MPKVTVRGSVTPCVDLPTGEIRVYELTDLDAADPASSPDSGPSADQHEPDDEPDPHLEAAWPEPAGNASRADWAAFLTARGVTVPDDAGRDDLREIWQQVDGGS